MSTHPVEFIGKLIRLVNEVRGVMPTTDEMYRDEEHRVMWGYLLELLEAVENVTFNEPTAEQQKVMDAVAEVKWPGMVFTKGQAVANAAFNESPSLDDLMGDAVAQLDNLSIRSESPAVALGTQVHSIIEDEIEERYSLKGTEPAAYDKTDNKILPPEKKYDGGKPDIARMKRQFSKALAAVALSGMYGAVKYDDNDGTSYKSVSNAQDRYASAGGRHDLAYAGGEQYADDSHVHHLSAKAWNALAELELAIDNGESVIDPLWLDTYYQDWERQADEFKRSCDGYDVETPTEDLLEMAEQYAMMEDRCLECAADCEMCYKGTLGPTNGEFDELTFD
jgi:hypothetical protein